MATLVGKEDKYFTQCSIRIPSELKQKVDDLDINLTQAAIAGIEEAVSKKEMEGGRE